MYTYISLPFAIICNTSFTEAIFPDRWKEARMIPLHKKDNATMLENYHLTSILSSISKILEKYVEGCLLYRFGLFWTKVTL